MIREQKICLVESGSKIEENYKRCTLLNSNPTCLSKMSLDCSMKGMREAQIVQSADNTLPLIRVNFPLGARSKKRKVGLD